MTKTYSPASEDESYGSDVYCVLYYFNCRPQIARVYATYGEAAAYLADSKINADNYIILGGKKYKSKNDQDLFC